MSETKKFVSIPTIDEVNLPDSLINKCREIYKRYGKYRLYDIINADLNNYAKYTREEREKFKSIELTKRYLYLYRKAMAETLSFAYNIDQTDLIDEDTKEFDDTNLCPYCGQPLTVISQIGQFKGFPKSHYNDVYKKYDKTVLFNRYPVKKSITISLADYLNTITPSTVLGYTFSYWSIERDDNKANIAEIRVLPTDVNTTITDEMYAVMAEDDRNKIIMKSEASIFNFLDTDSSSVSYGKIKLYAIYKSNTDNSYTSTEYNFTVSLADIFSIYSESLTTTDGTYKDAFDLLNTKSSHYELGYLSYDNDTSTNYVPDSEDNSDKNIIDYNNGNNEVNVVVVYYAISSVENADYVDYNKTIRQFAIEYLKEPYLADIVYSKDSNGNVTETEVGSYSFFQWSLDDEASVFILEDDRSLQLIQDVESVKNDDLFTIYALFKYDIKDNTRAYDDDCYASVYRSYRGIDKSYSKKLYTEYYCNDDSVTGEDKYLTKKEYDLLSESEKANYTPQESYVSYRGYVGDAGSSNAVVRDYKLRVIICSRDLTDKIQCISHDSKGNPTGVFLSGTTPGDYSIFYNLDKKLWKFYNDDEITNANNVVPAWINNSDTEQVVYEDPKDDQNWTKYVSGRYINRNEYLALSDENKLRCTVNKIYPSYSWRNDTYIVTSGTSSTEENYTIYELQNCKSIAQYNKQTGTLDGSYGVDTHDYSDTTKETYRLYKYYLSQDSNVKLNQEDLNADYDLTDYATEFGTTYSGDTWLYPITEDNIENFKKLVSEVSEVENHTKFKKNGNYYFYSSDLDIDISTTHLWPIDNTGEQKLNYKMSDLWKCASFVDGTILIYRHHVWKEENTKQIIDSVINTKLNIIAYKYNTSVSMDIFNEINESGEYQLRYDEITLTGPGLSEYGYYDSSEHNVIIPDTTVAIKYANISEKMEVPTNYSTDKIQVRRTYKPSNKNDPYYGMSEYQEYGVGTKVYALINSDTNEEGWVNWSDVSDTSVLYRYETEEEFNERVSKIKEENETYEVTLLGKKYDAASQVTYDLSSTDTSNYVKWYSSSDASFKRSDGKIVTAVSGGYPESTKEQYDPSPNPLENEGNDLFVTISETILNGGVKKLSISYSGDAEAVSRNNQGASTEISADIEELDSRTWWNQYGKILTDASEKNEYITNVGINFCGWIWLGWENPENFRKSDVRIPSNEGLVESYVFDDTDNYITLGFQRVLYPTQFNKTYYTSDGETLINDKTTEEPIKLLRYCDNPECISVKKRLHKTKWSYQNSGATIYQSTYPYAMNLFSLDEYNISLQNGLTKATDPIEATFGLSSTSKLNTLTVLKDESFISEEYDIEGFTLDKYPWHYKLSGDNPDQRLQYMLHRGGWGVPDDKRFEFEYKYATDEYSSTKMAGYKTTISEYAKYNDYLKLNHLKNIKQISHIPSDKYPDEEVVPMKERSIEIYQNRYKDVLFNTFENTYIQLNSSVSPYSLFNQEEIILFNSVLSDLFTYDKSNPSSKDYIDFKLKIINLMSDLGDYEFYKSAYWDEDKLDTYSLNKKLLNVYLNEKNIINSSGKIDLSEKEFESFINDNLKYYTVKITNDTWHWYENRPLYKFVIHKKYNALATTTIAEAMASFGDIPTYKNTKFLGWAKDELGRSFYNLDSNEVNQVIRINESVDFYLVYCKADYYSNDSSVKSDYKYILSDYYNTLDESDKAKYNSVQEYVVDSSLIEDLLYSEGKNDIYLKINIKDTLNKIWYYGESVVKSEIKETLSELHEKLAMPTEFMCCLFNFIIADKKYNIVVDDDGNVGSLFVPTGISSTINNDNKLSVVRTSDSDKYKGAVISKHWKFASDDDTGRSVYEQYLILYNTNTFDAYSFFNEGWLKDIYGANNASVKFPLYQFTSNPIETLYSDSSLLDVIPFTCDKYESAIALIYNKGIEIVDLANAKWITTNSTIISTYKLFGNSNTNIISCKLNEFNDELKLIIVSDNSEIATYDLKNDEYCDSNQCKFANNSYYLGYKIGGNTEIVETSERQNALLANYYYPSKKTEIDTTALKKRVGLVVEFTTLKHNSEFTGKPWVLINGNTPSLITPSEISDDYYDTLSDENKEKYRIHPKLTVQYAWNSQKIDEIEIPKTKDYIYRDVYTDELTKTTEGDFEVYKDGTKISLDEYFNYSEDSEKAKCIVYKLTTINYTFVRLSFNKNGIGIYDEEKSARLSSDKIIYAFYYQTGETVDPYYGYKIQISENIVNGSDTIYSDVFNEYLEVSKTEKSDTGFEESKTIDNWKTNNRDTDYKGNYTSNIKILSTISTVYPINGFYDSSSNTYIPYYIFTDGYKIQLVYLKNLKLYVFAEIDYSDDNELIDVKSVFGEMKVYLIFKNQRIVELHTSEFIPNEYSIPSLNDINLVVKTDNPSRNTVETYLTDDNRIVNTYFNYSTSNSNVDEETLIKRVDDYVGKDSNTVSVISTEISQVDGSKFVPKNQRWKIYSGNDSTKYAISQIN